MKKISKIASVMVALAAFCTATNVDAKKMTLQEIGDVTTRNTSQGPRKRIVYIYGDYVYVNSFSITDMNAAAHTISKNDKSPALYLQDGAGNWVNLMDPSQTVSATETVVDMTALIGEARDGNISESDDLYDDGYESDKFDAARNIETFDSDKAISITNIKLDKSSFGNAKQEYNNTSLTGTLSATSMELTETSPLLAFNNGYKTAKWFGVLVETNRALTTEDLKDLEVYVVSGAETRKYTIEETDLDSSNHDGSTSEFVMWLRAEELEAGAKLVVINGEGETQTVTVNYTPFDGISFEVPGTALTNLPEGVKSTVVGDTNVVSSANKDLTEVRFTQNGTKAAVKEGSDWKVVPVFDKTKLDGKEATYVDFGEHSAEHKFNLDNITVEKVTEPTEGADLELNITASDLLKLYNNGRGNYAWLGLVLNLGLDPQYITLNNEAVDYLDVVRHGGTLNVDFNEWLGFTNADKTMTLTYVNSQYAKDKVVVKVNFIASDKEQFKVEDVKAIGTDYDDPKTDALTDALVNYNNKAITTNGHIDGKLTITETTPLLSYKNVNAGNKEGKWFGLIITTSDDELTAEDLERYTFTLGTASYGVETTDIGVGASHYGAQANEFIMWITAEDLEKYGNEFTVYENGEERQTITIDFVASTNSSFYLVTDDDEITTKTGLKTDVEGVTASVVTSDIGEEKLNIFTLTGTGNKDVTEVYLQGTDKKAVVKDATTGTWSIKDMMDIPATLNKIVIPGKEVAIDKWATEHQWNQKAISDGVKITKSNGVYNVTITAKEFLYAYENGSALTGDRAWISVIFDLGLNPENIKLNGKDLVDTRVAGHVDNPTGTQFIEWLGFDLNNGETEKTVTYQNALVAGDTVTFNIKLVNKATTSITKVVSTDKSTESKNTNFDYYTVSALSAGKFTITEKSGMTTNTVENLGQGRWINLTLTLSQELGDDLSKYVLIIKNEEKEPLKIELSNADRVKYESGKTMSVWLKADELAPTATIVLKEVQNEAAPINVVYKTYFDLNIKGVNAKSTGKLYEESDPLANAYNELFAKNMAALTVTKTGSNNDYTVTLKSTTIILNKIPDASKDKHQRIGLIVDLGLDPKKLTLDGSPIPETDYAEDTINNWKPATGWEHENSFVIWIDETYNGKTLTFTYTETDENEAVIDVKEVNIHIVISQPEVVDWITTGVDGSALRKYDNDYDVQAKTSGVTFDANTATFKVTNSLTKFEVSIDGVLYTYLKNTDSGEWTMRQNIVVTDVQKSNADADIIDELYSENQQYNLTAIESIENNNNTITIKLNKLLPLKDVTYGDNLTAKLIPVVVDLGVNPADVVTEGYTINSEDYEDAYRHAGLSKDDAENMVVLWINADKALAKNGITIKVAHKNDSIQYNLVIKAEYNDTKTDLEAFLSQDSEVKELVVNETINLDAEELTIANKGAKISGTGAITGNVKIDTDDVTIEGITITGNVTVNEGANATLDGAIVTGKVDIQGDATMTDVAITGDVTIDANANAELTDADVTGKVDVKGTVTVDGEETSMINTEGNVFDVQENAKLTIKNGTFDNEKDDTVLIQNEKGIVEITGGTFNHSVAKDRNGLENSYYAIINHGTMTISGGTFNGADEKQSSLITNGYYTGGVAGSTLTINGGKFIGGLNTIKNDNFGVLTITKGEFSGAAETLILNWNKATISGGTFTASDDNVAIRVGKDTNPENGCNGELTISGGSFIKGTKDYVIDNTKNYAEDKKPTVKFENVSSIQKNAAEWFNNKTQFTVEGLD